jgi:hypothetical protein
VNLNVADVRRIAADAAREISPDLRIAGVVLSASGSEYVEVLVNIEGGRKARRQVSVGVRRKPPLSAVREQLASKLRAHYGSSLES